MYVLVLIGGATDEGHARNKGAFSSYSYRAQNDLEDSRSVGRLVGKRERVRINTGRSRSTCIQVGS